jgi:hypothetical protein
LILADAQSFGVLFTVSLVEPRISSRRLSEFDKKDLAAAPAGKIDSINS